VLLIQETMCVGSKVVEFLSLCPKDWNLCSLDVEGLSGGLVSGWNSNLSVICTNVIFIGLDIELRYKELG
jgi:hypothetical protein